MAPAALPAAHPAGDCGVAARRDVGMAVAGRVLLAALALLLARSPSAQPASAAVAVTIPAFSTAAPGVPPPPWRVVSLPKQRPPLTRFEVVPRPAGPALRVEADASYGNLVLDLTGAPPPAGLQLRWQWMLERGLARSDLSRKDGDDVPLKVCALFDLPLDGLPLGERLRLQAARALSGEHLPAATLCYVWDRLLPVGTQLPNVFSARVRYHVVSSGPARPGQWLRVERPLAEDFLQAFGTEARALPPLLAIAVGADADNTGGSSLGWVGDIRLGP